MQTNCNCTKKEEEWYFDKILGCWYVVRTCNDCKYYWEGPDHTKTSYNSPPSTGHVNRVLDDDEIECLRDRNGQFSIYCYDDEDRYGRPICFDEVEDIFQFVELNKYSHKKINVINRRDEIVLQVIDQQIVFNRDNIHEGSDLLQSLEKFSGKKSTTL